MGQFGLKWVSYVMDKLYFAPFFVVEEVNSTIATAFSHDNDDAVEVLNL